MALDETALDRFRDEILAAMRASEGRLEGRIADTRRDVAAQIAEARRDMDVVAEGLTSKIGLVAEGVVTLTERVSSEMREGFETLDRRVMRLETRLLSDPRG